MSGSQLIEWLRLNASAPAVKPTVLPASYFKFPPSPEPTALPPPPDHPNLAHPFTIQPDIYNALLSANVPITVALVYASIVTFLNSVNANRKYKPWAISRTRLFKLFVVLHNVILAVYSAWTFVGMLNALYLALPSWVDGSGVAGTVDALCKLHGPRGHGSAATYNATSAAWAITNRIFHLGADGLGPETTDVGRIWNEGLAFYGWLFYLSKFYEVIDTFIILAKGKKSSFLQTYHHAGAMLCMWAGIRYMSPPIWMFVLVNSFIHAIMYTFYLLSTIGIRVPKWFKQSLTTLQITQFVVGATYAFAHLFVAYQIPVSVPYVYHLGSAASSVLSNAPSEISSAASSVVSTASAGTGAWLKKVALRAAGHEGLAENVHNEQGRPFGIDAIHIAEDLVAKEETRYKDELQWVNCLDTSGQVFAILLNCLYLLPLTWLFAQFFITSYLKRVERRRSSSASELANVARLSFTDAGKSVARRVNHLVEEMHHTSDDLIEEAVLEDEDEVKETLQKVTADAKNTIKQGIEKVKNAAPSAQAEKVKELFKQDLAKVQKSVSESADKVVAAVTDNVKQVNVQAKAQSLKDTVAEVVEKAAENVKPAAEQTVESTQAVAGKAAENIESTTEQAVDNTKAAANEAAKKVKPASKKAAKNTKATASKVADTVEPASEETADGVEDTAGKTAENVKEAAENAQEQATIASKSSNDETNSSNDQQAQAGEQTDQPAEPSSPGSEDQKSPNENGTGADEATGQASSSPSDKTVEQHGKESQVGADESKDNDAQEGGESEESKEEKKTEDKIIDESQVVRDEDVDTDADGDASTGEKTEAKEEAPSSTGEADEQPSTGESEVREGKSFADAAKE